MDYYQLLSLLRSLGNQILIHRIDYRSSQKQLIIIIKYKRQKSYSLSSNILTIGQRSSSIITTSYLHD
jgi:hypothetical protein